MSFEFVNHNSGITDDSRRRIRRHAAKGHNVGRTVVRVTQETKDDTRLRPGALLEKAVKDSGTLRSRISEAGADTAVPLDVSRRVGDSFGCMSLPPHVTEQSRGVIRKVVWVMSNPYSWLTRVMPPKTAGPAACWVQMMFLDEAYFHALAAACLIALNKASVSVPEIPPTVYRHCHEMLHLLYERVDRGMTVSDETIATVIIASMFERYRGSYPSSAAHLDGLERMIHLRGGIRKLATEKPQFAYKIFRSDLEHTLHSGARTRYDLSDLQFPMNNYKGVSSPYLAGTSIDALGPGSQGRPRPQEFGLSLRVLLAEIRVLTTVLNDADADRRPKLDSHVTHLEFVAAGYRLIEIRPLKDLPSSNLADDAVYAGIACIVAILMLGLDGKPAPVPLIAGVIRSFWEDEHSRVSRNGQIQMMLLWVLFAAEGAAIFSDAADRDWIVCRAKETIDALGLSTWQEVRRTLANNFPWIHCLQDDAGLALWVAAEQHGR